MISTKQKLALGGLVTLSAAVWTPQLVERFGAETSAQVAVGAGPDENEMLTIELETSGGAPSAGNYAVRNLSSGPDTGPPSAEMPVVRGPSVGSPSARPVGDALSATAAPGGSRTIVSEVLRTLRQSEAFGVEDEAEAVSALIEGGQDLEEADVTPGIIAFLEAHPLRGTIVGESLSVALIGKHRVRLGEAVPGSSAVLTRVERGRVTLEQGGVSIDLELQPLETSDSLMRERSLLQAASRLGAGGVDPLQAGNGMLPGSAALASPTTATQNTDAGLTGTQGDF